MDADAIVQDALDAPEPGSEDFEAAVAAEFEVPSEPVEGQSPEVEEEVEEPALDDAPPPPPEAAEEPTGIPADKAEEVAAFYEWSQSPQGQTWLYTLDRIEKAGLNAGQLIDAMTRPQSDDSTLTRPPPPPADEYEDEYLDPATKKLHDELRTTQSELEQMRAQMQASQAQQTNAIIAAASQRFTEEHGISQEDTAQLINHIDRTVNLQGYAVDPQTGQQRDYVSTLYAAMEAALWANPDMRQRELDRSRQEYADRQKKDRKLASVGGTSGSVPQKPTPATPAEREEEAVQMITEAMGLAK